MRVLFSLEPLVLHGRPFHYWRWLDLWARSMRSLEALSAGHEVALLTNDALARRAVAPLQPDDLRGGKGLRCEQVAAVEQERIRRCFDAPNLDVVVGMHRGALPQERVAAYGAYARELLGGFVPDVVITLTPAQFLAAAFPGALVVASETGVFSRAPFPMSVFLDPMGMWDRSVLSVCAEALFARRAPPVEAELLEAFRAHYRPYLAAASPFAELEARLRSRFARLVFVPLQFGGEPGFETNGPFRTQGELLLHVLERLPGDVGVIAVEHPTAHWLGDVIDAETRGYLAEAHPRLTFVDYTEFENAGQLLIQHVDAVVALSTSLGLQALFWQKPLVSVGTSHLRALAAVEGVEALGASALQPRPGSDAVAAFLLARYLVPEKLATSGAWLAAFLERSLERTRRGAAGLELFDEVAPPRELRGLLCADLDRGAPLRAELVNGSFEDWPQGPGPFAGGEELARAWHLIDATAGRVRASRVSCDVGQAGSAGAAVRLERASIGRGTGPTMLLQRLPDVDRCAGAFVRVSFWARSETRSHLFVYLYQQFGAGPGQGTEGRTILLGERWCRHSYMTRVPRVEGRTLADGHHTELVFALPREEGAAVIELTGVELSQAL